MAKISMIRGDTRILAIPYLDPSGNPLDLTGATVFFTVNASDDPTDDTAAVVEKQVTSFICPINCTVNGVDFTKNEDTTTAGVAWITLSNPDTQDVAPDTYFYDAQVKDASADVTSSKQDQFIVTADITRRIS